MRNLIAALAFCVLFGGGVGSAPAQIQFIQLTDPHLFDAGEDADNAAVLTSCITETNACLTHGAQYRFAVLTGDLGIEKLVKPDGQNVLIPDEVTSRLKAGAEHLGKILATSRIKTWLIVPGNNDLIDEVPDTINHYQAFVKFLQDSKDVRQSDLKIIDLTPYTGSDESGIYRDGKFAFLGFNNASFKSNGLAKNKNDWELPFHHKELVEVEKRLDRVTEESQAAKPAAGPGQAVSEFVYIFYHIPEVDDPYYLGLWRQDPQSKKVDDWLKKKDAAPKDPYRFSGWAVKDQIRLDWDRIVGNPHVKGVFAGHLHDQNRDTYRQFRWLENKAYATVTQGKLFICPPIAVKRQTKNDVPQARGFRLVSIAADGHPTSEIVWCEGANIQTDSGRIPCSQPPKAIAPREVPPASNAIANKSTGMFGSVVLDVALGLVFVYLLLSLVCSAANEGIESWSNTRGANLFRGLKEMLAATRDDGILLKRLYEHPLIFGLFKGEYKYTVSKGPNMFVGTSLPEYIPARTFALALMDVVQSGTAAGAMSGTAGATVPPSAPVAAPVSPVNVVVVQSAEAAAALPAQLVAPPAANPSATNPPANGATANHIANFRATVNAMGNNEVRRALLSLIDAAGNDASRVRENIEGWYNSAMDRVSGWYKERVQICVFFIAVVLVGALNADTLAIVNGLSNDTVLRNRLSQAAVAADEQAVGADGQPDIKKFAKPLDQLGQVDLPIGWRQEKFPDWPWKWSGRDFSHWFHKFIGLMITVFAISLGAPFWFDLLNRFVVVRTTVKPHEKSPEESSRG